MGHFSVGIEENKEKKENRHVFASQARFMVGIEGCRKGRKKGSGGLLEGEGKRKGEKTEHLCRRRPDFIPHVRLHPLPGFTLLERKETQLDIPQPPFC